MKQEMQDRKDARGIALEKAGIKGFMMPLVVYDKDNGSQRVTAEARIYTSLAAEKRGVHLSKLIDALLRAPSISRESLKEILKKATGDAEKAFIELEFLYFKEKESPVSKIKHLLDYKCRISAELGAGYKFIIEVSVPVTTTCPDSKELSSRGAHSQRSIVKIKADGDVWFEDLIRHAEKNASCEIYQVLKKEDDKHVTERSYDRAQFAEDLVRNIAVSVKRDARIKWFSVETENMESSHNYNAYALFEKRR